MCVTSQKANLENTITGMLVNHNTKTHTLLYQNKATNLSGGPNCMILPIMGTVKPAGLTDTTPFNKFIDTIVDQTKPQVKSFSASRGGGSKGIKVVEVGAYTVIIAKGASTTKIQEALKALPAEKRPTISNDLITWYKSFYGNPTLLLCCFSSNDTIKTQPIMVEYTPLKFDTFMIPGADSHDGGIPKMGEPVDRDHVIMFGMIGKNEGQSGSGYHKVQFEQPVPDAIRNAGWQSWPQESMGKNSDWAFLVRNDGTIKMMPEITTAEQVAKYYC